MLPFLAGVLLRTDPPVATPHIRHARRYPSTCSPPEDVDTLINLIKVANDLGVTIFPRNGFLLGIVRHGGFLPNEKQDADLGVLETPVLLSNPTFQVGAVTWKFVVNRDVPAKFTRWRWRGLHPLTNQSVPYNLVVFNSVGYRSGSIGIFSPLGNGQLLYPFWSERGNDAGFYKEAIARMRRSSSFVPDPGYTHYRFDESDIMPLRQATLYDRHVLIPRNAERILSGLYGEDWGRVIRTRVHGAEKLVQNTTLRPGAVPPRPLCERKRKKKRAPGEASQRQRQGAAERAQVISNHPSATARLGAGL